MFSDRDGSTYRKAVHEAMYPRYQFSSRQRSSLGCNQPCHNSVNNLLDNSKGLILGSFDKSPGHISVYAEAERENNGRIQVGSLYPVMKYLSVDAAR